MQQTRLQPTTPVSVSPPPLQNLTPLENRIGPMAGDFMGANVFLAVSITAALLPCAYVADEHELIVSNADLLLATIPVAGNILQQFLSPYRVLRGEFSRVCSSPFVGFFWVSSRGVKPRCQSRSVLLYSRALQPTFIAGASAV